MNSFNPSIIEGLLAFKTIHVLNDVRKNNTLKATHFCCPVVGGSNPLWIVWTATGKFVRYASSRRQIEEAYPNKAWKTTMASWALTDADTEFKDIKKRVRFLEEMFNRKSGRLEE